MILKHFKHIKIVFLLLILLSACSIQKGFESLDIYNYFDAKKQFEKSIKRDKSPAAYGLSVIYFRKDNPFHNLDSAYHYSLLSVEAYKDVTQKKQLTWSEKLNFNLDTAKVHREKISDLAFSKKINENTVDGFQLFMSQYPWSQHISKAIIKRDSLAFELLKLDPTSTHASIYLEKFPQSLWYQDALNILYQAQYAETIESNQIDSYITFVQTYPDNPFLTEAEYQIYHLSTKENTISDYVSFIKKFPHNPYINTAWTNLYRKSTSDYTKEAIINFQNLYPDFPFPELIERDLVLVDQNLYLFMRNNKYGFMDEMERK